MSNKGLKIKVWIYKVLNSSCMIERYSVRAYTRENADKQMRKWAKEEGFRSFKFVTNDISAEID